MKILIFCFSFFLSIPSFAITAEEILIKMGKVYEKENEYEVHMRYELFKGEKGTEIEDSYDGFMLKNKSKVYQKIDETEFIVTPDFCLKISHSEKIVQLMLGEPYKNQDIDFVKTLKECKELKFTEDLNYYFITMILKKNSQVPYSHVKVKVNKSNFHLHQLDLYYWNLEDFSKDPKKKDIAKPHVRIVYSKFSKKLSLNAHVFHFDTYFETIKNMISPVGVIKSYEFFDNRVN